MSKWKIETTKGGTEVFIVNNKYRIYMGDAFDNLGYDAIKQNNLLKDAKIFCNKLNKEEE